MGEVGLTYMGHPGTNMQNDSFFSTWKKRKRRRRDKTGKEEWEHLHNIPAYAMKSLRHGGPDKEMQFLGTVSYVSLILLHRCVYFLPRS